MSPVIALSIAGALLIVTALVGLVLRRRDGRRRNAGTMRVDPQDVTDDFGSHATLVQFSTEMCARCPQVRRMLSTFASALDGVQHLEVDLTHRPDLAARYRVMQTPTTFLIDHGGAVIARFHGVPQQHALTEAIAAA